MAWGSKLFQWAQKWLDRKPKKIACGCFTASTLVLTPAGAMPIDQVGPDAMVYAASYLTAVPIWCATPNARYHRPATRLASQPIQKSYRDWNTDWPENSWEVTECHIPYQAAYVRLLSELAP